MNKKIFGAIFTFVFLVLSIVSFSNITNAENAVKIISLSPSSGRVGDTIVINGENFTGVDKILFGTKDAGLDFKVISLNKIEAKIPVGAVTGKITVKTTVYGDAVSTNSFKIVTNSNTAKINGFSPTEGKVGDLVGITGVDLNSISKIYFGTTEAIAKTSNSSGITVNVPTGATTGKIKVVTSGYGTATSATDFKVLDANGAVVKATPTVINNNFSNTGNNGIVPKCNVTGTLNTTTGEFANPCDFNYFMLLINNIIKFLLFTIATPLVALIIIYTGYLFLTAGGSAGQTEKAKHILFNVVIGYIIALAAWLIVNTILSAFNLDPTINTFLEK